MPEIILTLTDEQFAAVAANVPDVEKYLQGQVDTIADQHVVATKKRVLVEVGLSPVLADAGLDEDQVAMLVADAVPKREAKLAAEADAKALAEAPGKA